MSKSSWQFLGVTKSFAKKKPNRLIFDERPLVIFWQGDKLVAFIDRCPHRSYPLSEGYLKEGGSASTASLTCSYHGWEFSADGTLLARPGFEEECPPEYKLKKVHLTLVDDLVFACLADEAPPIPPWFQSLYQPGCSHYRMLHTIKADKIHVVENLLDPFHTHFLHGNLLRSDKKRAPVDVKMHYTSSSETMELNYFNEPTPAGWISRIFENTRTKTVGRYIHPGVVVIEYWTANGFEMSVTLLAATGAPHTTIGCVIFQVAKRRIPFFLVRPIISAFSRALVRQDIKALEILQQNCGIFQKENFWVSKEDVVFKTLKKIESGVTVEDFEASYRIFI